VATNGTEVYTGEPSNDYSLHPTDKNILSKSMPAGSSADVDLYSFDFGGQAAIIVSTTAPDSSPVERILRLPLDTDIDLLPDAWEAIYNSAGFNQNNANSFSSDLNDGQKDIDTSLSNTLIGDGLTNFREYRGIIYDNSTHERLNPTRKDIFVRGDNFGNSTAPSSAPDILNFSINFAVNAFEEANITVHDVTGMPSFSGATEPPHIDILVVTNNTTGTNTLEGSADGYVNHDGARYWSWDTKGASYIGTSDTYNIYINPDTGAVKRGTYTYHLNLMHYFLNRPYWDETTNPINSTYVGLLDPLNLVEDYRQENGTGPETSKGQTEDRYRVNGLLDGDRKKTDWRGVLYGSQIYRAGYNFSTFDSDGDGLVENPAVTDSKSISREYTLAESQFHTVIHEIGHGVGIAGHTTDPTCVMYGVSNNWDRAGHFSDYARGQIKIHNRTE